MQRQFLAGVALAVMAGSAFAADMPLKAVAPVALYDWSGTYIGGVIGGAWGTNDISDPGLGIIGARCSAFPSFRPTTPAASSAASRAARAISSASWSSAGKATSPGAA